MIRQIIGLMAQDQSRYFSSEELAGLLKSDAKQVRKILRAGVATTPPLFFDTGDAWQLTGEAEALYRMIYVEKRAVPDSLAGAEQLIMAAMEDSLEPIAETLQVFEPQIVQVLDVLYEHPIFQDEDVVQFAFAYKVYLVRLGVGNRPVFLITPPYVNLPLGTTELLIRRLAKPFKELKIDEPDMLACQKICELYGIKVQKDREGRETWEECWNVLNDLAQDRLIFCAPANPIRKELLDAELRTWKQEDVRKLVEDYYAADGWDIDDDLKYIYSADKLKITHGKLSPYEVMKYQPHKIVVTNTKVGKTSVGRMNGLVLDRVTGSRFLGFSTAKDINPGLGNGLLEPTYFDEVSSFKTIFIDHILNYLELGETRVEVGKMGIITKGWSCCNFHSNPEVPTDDAEHMLIGLSAFIQKFSERLDAIGSRMALIVFTTKWQRARKTHSVSSAQKHRTKALFEALIDMSIPKVESLFCDPEVVAWLEQPVPEYEQQVKALIRHRDAFIPNEIKQLYVSHCEGASRRLRGFAFKKAVLDHLPAIYFDELEWTTFFASCEYHLRQVQRINIASLLSMCTAGFNKKDLFSYNFQNIPDYLKVLVISTALWQAQTHKEIAPLAELEPLWDLFYEDIKNQPGGLAIDFTNYQYFSKVVDRVTRVKGAHTQKRLEPFGFELWDQAGTTCVRIKKNDALISHISQENEFLKACVLRKGENTEENRIGSKRYEGEIEKEEKDEKNTPPPLQPQPGTLSSFFGQNRSNQGASAA